MPEITSCPECQKKVRVPDDLLGKKVRCPGCGNTFTAKVAQDDEEDEAPPPRPAPRPARGEGISEKRAKPPVRDRDDEDDEDERPRSRRRDEDDEDERPRSRKREDDDDDEDDRRRVARKEDIDDRRRSRRDDDDDDRPRSRRSRDEDDYDDDYDDRRGSREMQGWRGVRAGLNLVVIAGWLFLGLIGVAVLGGGVLFLLGVGMVSSAAAAGPGARPPSGLGALAGGSCVFVCILGLLALSELIVRLIGWGMCMQVPQGRGQPSRGLCIAAFCCAVAAVLISIGGSVIGGMGNVAATTPGANPLTSILMAQTVGNIFSIISNVLGIAAFILWLFFLRSICLQLRNSEMAGRVLTLFIAWMIYGVLSVILVGGMLFLIWTSVATALAGGGTGGLGGSVIAFLILVGVLFLAGVGLYVWYILTVQQVRTVVERALRRG